MSEKYKSEIRKRLEKSGDPVRRARLPKRMKMAAKISNAIAALDWNNKDLAERLGKYSSEISKWLKGDHNFTIDTLSDIEEILGISLLALDDKHYMVSNKNLIGSVIAHSSMVNIFNLREPIEDVESILSDGSIELKSLRPGYITTIQSQNAN